MTLEPRYSGKEPQLDEVGLFRAGQTELWQMQRHSIDEDSVIQ